MTTIHIGMFQSLMIAIFVIYLGDYIRAKFPVFKKYCLPSPVIGGTLFAILVTCLYGFKVAIFEFDYKTINTFFYNVFFAAAGLSAGLGLLKKGGKLVLIFSILAALLAVLQNVLALGVGVAMGMNPLVALMAGSTPLTGGHGNSASFGPLAESMGGPGALEVAIASATFGLITGCLFGGPIGRRLIRKNNLDSAVVEQDQSDKSLVQTILTSKNIHHAVFILLIACGIGQSLFAFFQWVLPTVQFPIHVMCMLGGIIIRLILDRRHPFKNQDSVYEGIEVVGSVSLAIFVSLSIITMKLWQLADLALPLITILILQLILMYIFAVYITFKLCGKNYDAAIISVGHVGFGLGAVPVSMATMTAVCSEFKYSKVAFFVVPLVGGFISNITNAIAITVFLNIAKSML